MWRPILRTLVVVALILLVALGIAQDQEVLHIESAYTASDPDFPIYVSALTGTALTSSNRFQVLVNGNQVYPSMLEAIERARRRISFETYI
jgi:cardiolipin synthase